MEDLRDMVVLSWSVQFDITHALSLYQVQSAWTEDTDSHLLFIF